MFKFKENILAILFLGLLLPVSMLAQDSDDVLRYSLEYPSYDARSLVVPGVSQATGFGGFQDNPASMALSEKSYFSFDLSSRFINETGSYLGNSTEHTDNQTSVGDLGIVYKVPTIQGSLVVGGGYSQTTDFNRALSASGRNNQSTITDFYNSSFADDSLFFAAFDVYAIDFATTDSSYSDTKSIFRFFDNNFYPGINQDVELTERGNIGEYSAFLATEVLKDFSVGVSIGYLSGSYSYKREFLESDRQNDYNAAFIDTDGDGEPETDIDRILSTDSINGDIRAFSGRIGFVFEPLRQLSIGGSYEFPSTLHIDETYNTVIETTFDNGVVFDDDAPGRFSYKIVRPHRLKGGFTLKGEEGINVSASAEAVFYRDARIEFDEVELNTDENAINDVIRSNFENVINLRAGLEYEVNNRFIPRVGYAYQPSPQGEFGDPRQFFNGGFSSEITEGLWLDFGLQYSIWKDENTLYRTPSVREVVEEDVTRLHMMAGIRIDLN